MEGNAVIKPVPWAVSGKIIPLKCLLFLRLWRVVSKS